MPTLVTALSQDSNGLFFAGPANYLPAGTRVGSTDYAIAHTLLVDANNNPLVVALDMDSGAGTANRMGVGLLVPASGGPVPVPGDINLGLNVRMLGGASTPAKTEDSASASGDVGMGMMAIRKNVPVALSDTDGDYEFLQMSAGRLWTWAEINVTAGAASLTKAEDAAHASGDNGVGILAVQKATPTDLAGADGDYEFLQMKGGRLWVNGIITDIVPQTGATNLGKAEDAAHASGDTGVMALGVRKDVPTALSSADGDYSPPTLDPLGATWVRQQSVAAVNAHVSVNSAVASTPILSSVPLRRGLILNNTDENDCYLKYGTTASATSFTARIPAGGYWEMPQPIYTGAIEAAWAGDGSGALIGSEL